MGDFVASVFRGFRGWMTSLILSVLVLSLTPLVAPATARSLATAGQSLTQPIPVGYLKRENATLALEREWQVWQTSMDLCRFGSIPPRCVYYPAGWWTLPYGTMPVDPLAPAIRHRHHKRCRWRLTVTGGQKPGSTIVLHVWNTCDGPWWKGPQVTKHVGTI